MLVIVDYGMGNLFSVKNMIKYLGYDSMISGSLQDIMSADRLILPGVGNFGSAMQTIRERGMQEVLDRKVLVEKVPILGICLGMQLLTEYSEEGECKGFGWIPGAVTKFYFEDMKDYKVPHMGWDYINIEQNSDLLDGIGDRSRYYFVHSYYVTCKNRENAVATTDYGVKFDSVIQKDNVVGTQFHPEKSHKFGMKILRNFLENFYVS